MQTISEEVYDLLIYTSVIGRTPPWAAATGRWIGGRDLAALAALLQATM